MNGLEWHAQGRDALTLTIETQSVEDLCQDFEIGWQAIPSPSCKLVVQPRCLPNLLRAELVSIMLSSWHVISSAAMCLQQEPLSDVS